MRSVLFVILTGLGITYATHWVKSVRKTRRTQQRGGGLPSPLLTSIGFVTNFFDTLGIGSFAPTTSWYKIQDLVPDQRIPGTMHVGHTLPVIAQAFIFIAIVEVEMATLTSLIGSSVLGAWLGAGVVARWPRRYIQIGMGIALLLAGLTFVMANLGYAPVGGESVGLTGIGLGVASVGFFILGALMTLGIGMYAPAMIVVSLMGMNPVVAFPIMMGSSAFLMPVASLRFLKADAYRHLPALGLALGGLPAVLIAAFLVRSLPLTTLRWLVVVVVTYAAVAMLRSAWSERKRPPSPANAT